MLPDRNFMLLRVALSLTAVSLLLFGLIWAPTMNEPTTLFDFLSGALIMGFLVAGLFFLRFWTGTRDGLFLAFAFAFWLLGLTQAILALGGIPVEERSWVYLIRLAAFLLILVSIFPKNRRA